MIVGFSLFNLSKAYTIRGIGKTYPQKSRPPLLTGVVALWFWPRLIRIHTRGSGIRETLEIPPVRELLFMHFPTLEDGYEHQRENAFRCTLTRIHPVDAHAHRPLSH